MVSFRGAIIENADEPRLNAGVLTHTWVWRNMRFFCLFRANAPLNGKNPRTEARARESGSDGEMKR
jgi:hypothetical protein